MRLFGLVGVLLGLSSVGVAAEGAGATGGDIKPKYPGFELTCKMTEIRITDGISKQERVENTFVFNNKNAGQSQGTNHGQIMIQPKGKWDQGKLSFGYQAMLMVPEQIGTEYVINRTYAYGDSLDASLKFASRLESRDDNTPARKFLIYQTIIVDCVDTF